MCDKCLMKSEPVARTTATARLLIGVLSWAVVLLIVVVMQLSSAAKGEDGYNPNHRLVGVGCGPQRLTFTADEEDHFPAPCYAIGTPEELCPPDPAMAGTPLGPGGDEPIDAKECAEYLGNGY